MTSQDGRVTSAVDNGSLPVGEGRGRGTHITENTSQSVDVTKKGRWAEVLDYLMIAIGTAFYCLGVTLFMLPYKLTTGGVAGIASIIFYATGLEVQVSYLAINLMFLVVAVKILGWRFCMKTIAGVGFATLWMWVFQRVLEDQSGMLPQICGTQSFMACVLGAMIEGLGLSVCFLHNGSMGGTDIVAACVNKFRDISLGQIILACDICIISSCYFVFHDIERVVFGYVMMAVCSISLDYCIRRQHQAVKFEIFSRNYAGVADAITKAGFGVTVMDGEGWWTHSERKVVVCIASKRYAPIIARCIKRVDPYAFLSIINVESVFGEGFSTMKTKVKGQLPIVVYVTNDEEAMRKARLHLGTRYDVRSLSDIGCIADLPQTHATECENVLEKARFVTKYFGFDCYATDADGGNIVLIAGNEEHTFSTFGELNQYLCTRQPRHA